MPGKRPPGPVFRPDPDPTEGEPMTTTPADIQARWEYLAAGAQLAANLTLVAREQSLEHLGAAVALLTRDQLEASVMALALLAPPAKGDDQG
jgi:hypothetical protein